MDGERRYRLEDFKRENVFTTPEGYFEQLPLRIQTRIVRSGREALSPFFQWSLRLAVPALALIAGFVVWLNLSSSAYDPENLIASVGNEAIVYYLDMNGITTDELLETFEKPGFHFEPEEDDLLDQITIVGDITDLYTEYGIEF